MNYNELDVVLLKDKSIATILEVYDNGACFLMEIQKEKDNEVTEIKLEEIDKLIYKNK